MSEIRTNISELRSAWPLPSKINWGEHYIAVSSIWPRKIKSCSVIRRKFARLLAELSLKNVRNREVLLGLWNDTELEPIWLHTINADTYRATVWDYPADDVESVVVALHDILRVARAQQPTQYPALNRWMWRAYCVSCSQSSAENKIRCARCAENRTNKRGEIDEICEMIRRTMRDSDRQHMLSREACIRWVANTIHRKNNFENARQKIKKEQREAEQRFALTKLPGDDAENAIKKMSQEQRERHNRSVPLARHVLLGDRLALLDEFTAIFHK